MPSLSQLVQGIAWQAKALQSCLEAAGWEWGEGSGRLKGLGSCKDMTFIESMAAVAAF